MTDYKCVWCYRGFASDATVAVCPHCGGVTTLEAFAVTCGLATSLTVLQEHEQRREVTPQQLEALYMQAAESVRKDKRMDLRPREGMVKGTMVSVDMGWR